VTYVIAQNSVRRFVRVLDPNNKVIISIFEKNFTIEGKKIFIAKSIKDAEIALDNDGRFLKS
jgi:hypothetical protein